MIQQCDAVIVQTRMFRRFLGHMAALARCGLLLRVVWSYVGLFVMTVNHTKWLNRSWCHSSCWLWWAWGTVY